MILQSKETMHPVWFPSTNRLLIANNEWLPGMQLKLPVQYVCMESRAVRCSSDFRALAAQVRGPGFDFQ